MDSVRRRRPTANIAVSSAPIAPQSRPIRRRTLCGTFLIASCIILLLLVVAIAAFLVWLYLSAMPSPVSKPWTGTASTFLKHFEHKSKQHICFTTWGTRGDMHPVAILAHELASRGHTVRATATKDYASLLKPYGLDVTVTADDDVLGFAHNLTVMYDDVAATFAMASRYARRLTTHHLQDFWSFSAGCDVMIAPWLQFVVAPVHVAEARGIPLIYLLHDPLHANTEYAYDAMASKLVHNNVLVNLFQGRLLNWVCGWLVSDVVNAFRTSHGLKPVRRWFYEPTAPATMHSFPTLVTFSKHIWPLHSDAPDWHVQTGYWSQKFAPADQQNSDDVQRFVEQCRSLGRPLHYYGFGSWRTHNATAVTQAIVSVTQQRDACAIMLARTVDDALIELQDKSRFLAGASFNHAHLFPLMDVVVHHGGAGTAGAVLLAGAPSIVVPAMSVQGMWGDLVQRAGVGVLLRQQDVNERTLTASLDALSTEETRKRAQVLRAQVQLDGGLAQAADMVERCLRDA